MTQIELDGVHYILPESWDEINTERLPKLIELVYLVPESGRMHHALIQLALNIRPKAWKKLHQRHFSPSLREAVRRKNAEVLHQLVQILAWCWEKPMDKQPFPSITVGKEVWLLPEQGFVTLSFGELTDLYIHLQTFIQQTVAGDEHLDYLVATACRPRRPRGYTLDGNWNGDHREPYNEFIVRERVKVAAALPFPTKMAVMLYIAATIKNVMARYTLFDQSDAPGDGTPEVYTGQGFLKNQHLLAEKGIFGNLRQTQEANAHEVLLFLEEHRFDLKAKQEAERNHDHN